MNKPDREQEAKRKTEQGVRWGPKLREQSVGKKACQRDREPGTQWLTVSNALTVSRIIFVPFIVYSIFSWGWVAAFILFSLAALTDLLDGYFARLLKEPTVLGAWLDPVADKFLVLSTFGALSFVHFSSLVLPWWFFVLMVTREAILALGILFLLFTGRPVNMQPTRGGKLTTFFQILLILWLFLCYCYRWSPRKSYSMALLGLAFFALFSLGQYVVMGLTYARSQGKNER